MHFGDVLLFAAAFWGVWDATGRLLRWVSRVPACHLRSGNQIQTSMPLTVDHIHVNDTGYVWVTLRPLILHPEHSVNQLS